jgi:hypothetical protein
MNPGPFADARPESVPFYMTDDWTTLHERAGLPSQMNSRRNHAVLLPGRSDGRFDGDLSPSRFTTMFLTSPASSNSCSTSASDPVTARSLILMSLSPAWTPLRDVDLHVGQSLI